MFHFWSYCVKNVLFLFSFVSLPSLGVDLNIWLKYNERHRRQTGGQMNRNQNIDCSCTYYRPATHSVFSLNQLKIEVIIKIETYLSMVTDY